MYMRTCTGWDRTKAAGVNADGIMCLIHSTHGDKCQLAGARTRRMSGTGNMNDAHACQWGASAMHVPDMLPGTPHHTTTRPCESAERQDQDQ